MKAHLSPYRLNKAREVFNTFNVFNAVSWNLLVGIIITLFALRLGASSTFIGFMSATFYIALFLLPLGKVLSKRFSITGVYSFALITRSCCMLFAAAAPFFDYSGYRNTALFLIMLSVLFFNLFRGIGMVSNNPILGVLASGPDRGSYLTQIQIVNSAIGMFGSFLIAMVLGLEPPLFIFSIFLCTGVITGVISGTVIRKVPEPPRENDGHGMKLVNIFKDAFSHDYLRHFMFILFLVALVSGVMRTFIVVYAREVFGHNDGLISLYSVFGGLGFLMAGMIVKFLVDRIGAKPLFLVCLMLGLASTITIVFFPQSALENMTGAILFMVFVFFMLHFGFLGSEGIAQTYFLALIPQEKILDMGILYFFIFGAAGATGSFLSGLFVDILLLTGIQPYISFKILFIIMIALTILALARQNTMKSLGSHSLKDALEVIFSFRDLRAISLLGKLNRAKDSDEEKLLIGALHDTPSYLAIDGLLERARSPHLATRLESIRALEKMDTLSINADKALMEDIVNHPFTTAYISARILGNNKCLSAIPKLREAAYSEDYMLAGEAIIALAKMKDEKFRTEIEKMILETQNPRLKIMGAEALGLFHNSESIPVLLDILRGKNPPPYLRDEVTLAIAAILDTRKKFYKMLARLTADDSQAVTLVMDEAEATQEFVRINLNKKKIFKTDISGILNHSEKFHNAVIKYVKENNGVDFSRWILELPEPQPKQNSGSDEGSSSADFSRIDTINKSILSEIVIDEDLNGFNCLRLLVVHWAAQELRIRAAMIK